MKSSIQQHSSAMNWTPVLQYQLVPNTAAKAIPQKEGGLKIQVPTLRPRWHVAPISWIVRIPPHKTIELDPLGQRFWELCQPGVSVETLVDQFAQELDLTFHESRMTITTFAVQLVQRGALAVLTPTP